MKTFKKSLLFEIKYSWLKNNPEKQMDWGIRTNLSKQAKMSELEGHFRVIMVVLSDAGVPYL